MDDRITETFQREFELEVARIAKGVRKLFEALQAAATEDVDLVEVPFIGGFYDPREPHAWAVNLVIKAKTAQAWVEQQVADPLLPLCVKDIAATQNEPDPSLALFGRYAGELRDSNWDIQRHPTFAEYYRAHGGHPLPVFDGRGPRRRVRADRLGCQSTGGRRWVPTD